MIDLRRQIDQKIRSGQETEFYTKNSAGPHPSAVGTPVGWHTGNGTIGKVGEELLAVKQMTPHNTATGTPSKVIPYPLSYLSFPDIEKVK